jgi:cytochrome c-type biogenesis protein CcmF
VTAGVVGPVLIWAAIALGVIAVVTGRRWALVTATFLSGAATVLLASSLVGSDFSLAYVARTTSLATPWPYRLAATWGGMEGSLLFYSTLTLVLGAAALRRRAPTRVAAGVGTGLLTITAVYANPFQVLDIPAVDGEGLLAILQHPAMVYHPPILYLGLVTLVVPFALTITAARSGVDGPTRRRVRRWLYVSWTLLTVGMAAGANWAYVELGWGGYWAWDPVENTALIPWLACTVYLHTSRVEDAGGRLRRWNRVFAGLPFALSVMGVYLTRSGVTGSIHSFAEDPALGRILLGSAVVVTVAILIVAARSRKGEPWDRLEWGSDTWQVINAVLLTATLAFVVAGTAYPAYETVFGGQPVTVDNRFFVLTVLPLAILVAVALSVALGASWWAITVTALLVAAEVMVSIGVAPAILLLAPALASLALLVYRLLRLRPRGTVMVAHIAHIGMALFLVAVAGSALGADFSGSMVAGDRVTVGGHEVTLEEVSTGETDRYLFARASFDVDGETLEPEIRAYEDQDTPVAEPVLRSGPRDDVIVAISLLFPDGDTVAVSVFVRPLVWWVWVGAALMGLAGLFAIGGVVSGRRRGATATPRREGTTSGIGSR